MDKTTVIEKMAHEIEGKLKGGSLFGRPIDFDNSEMVIVAAYQMGKGEELKNTLEVHKIHRLLRGR